MKASENKKSLQDAFLSLFVNRQDVYAAQKNKGYLKVEQSLTTKIIHDHLQGKITIGVYQLDNDNMVKWLCFDLDPGTLANPKETAQTIIQECVLRPESETPRFYEKAVLLEASRYPDASYHIWVFFEPLPVSAKVVRWLGLKILEHANVNPKLVEVFPKQTELTKDRPYGNLVKLPLGFHRKANKWSRFLDLQSFEPLSTSCVFNVQGVSFLESELVMICNFEDKRHIQIKFQLPKNYQPLKSKEEDKIARFLVKYWHAPTPSTPGNRNRLEMVFLGWCLKKGVSFGSAYRIVDQVTVLTSDEERSQRLQLVKYHYQSRQNIASQLLGISGLKEIVREIVKND